MDITHVSVSSTTYASRTNTTITAPASIQNNDVLLLTIITAASSEAPDPTAVPSGFAQIGTTIDISDGSAFNLESRTYLKVASGESGNYTVNHSNCASQGHIVVFRGCDTATPLDATPTQNSGGGLTRTWTGLTTVTTGAMLVAIGFDWGDSTNNLTPPTGMTEVLDNELSYIAYEVRPTAGATGNRSHTNNNNIGDHPWGARLIALRPAAASAPKSLLVPQSSFRHMIVR